MFGRLVLAEDARSRPLAAKLLKSDSYSFRACISATQEKLQTWRLSLISQAIDLFEESEVGTEWAESTA
jgi:hypothetical protein